MQLKTDLSYTHQQILAFKTNNHYPSDIEMDQKALVQHQPINKVQQRFDKDMCNFYIVHSEPRPT